MRKTGQGTLAVLLALAVLAGGVLTLLTRQNQKAEEAVRAAAEGTISLSRFAVDDLSEIVLETGGETLTLKADADGWTLRPSRWPIPLRWGWASSSSSCCRQRCWPWAAW